MSYKYYKVIGVRKVVWDQLWHVMYKIKEHVVWDRVSKKEALENLLKLLEK